MSFLFIDLLRTKRNEFKRLKTHAPCLGNLKWMYHIYIHTHTHYKTLVKIAFKILKNGLRMTDLRNLEKHETENIINMQGPPNIFF